MLSVIRSSTSGQHFAVFVVGNIFDGFDVKITNGKDLFRHEGLIKEESHKPQSRSKESKLSYMTTLHSALTTTTVSTKDGSSSTSSDGDRFVHDFNVNGSDESIQLVIKERVANTATMSILFRSSFIKQYSASAPFPATATPIMDLFFELQVNVSTKQQTIECLERDNKRHQELNDNYVKDIKLLNDLKDNLQDTMIQRMCLILNSKKLELQRLQDRIEELESALGATGKGSSSQTLGSQSQSQSQVLPTVAKRGRKKADAPATTATKKTPAAKKTATSVDAIQKKAASKTAASKAKTGAKSSSTNAKGGKKKRGKGSDSEQEDDDEENSDDRDFIADEDEEDDENSSQDSESSNNRRRRKKHTESSEEESGDSEAEEQPKSRSTTKANAGPSGRLQSQSFLTQKHASMEVDSADIMNFLSHKNNGNGLTQMSRGNSLTDTDSKNEISGTVTKESSSLWKNEDEDKATVFSSSSAAAAATGTTRRGKRSSALLSQDDEEDFRSNIQLSKPSTNFAKDAAIGSSSSNFVPPSTAAPTTVSTAATSAPAAKKKKASERFLDSDDEDGADGCLNFI